MNPLFAPVSRARLAEKVADAVRDVILRGSLRPGDPLPAERDLAEQFGVNRSSVREALNRLEAWGLVEVRQGAGVRVADFLSTSGLALLPWLLAPGGQLDPDLLRDLLELRVALLGFTARLAARRADKAALAALADALDRLNAAQDLDAVQAADFDLFEALVAGSGNRVLGLLVAAIGQVYRHNQATFAVLYALPFDTADHAAALAALRARDADAAAAAMERYGRRALAAMEPT